MIAVCPVNVHYGTRGVCPAKVGYIVELVAVCPVNVHYATVCVSSYRPYSMELVAVSPAKVHQGTGSCVLLMDSMTLCPATVLQYGVEGTGGCAYVSAKHGTGC